jgi:hypothetical protein
VQATLHQELALGLMDELNCLRGRRLAVRYVDNLKTIDVQAKPARYGGNLRRRADKNWDDDASFGRFDGTAQGRLIAWVNDDRFRCRHLLRFGDQTVVFRLGTYPNRSDGCDRNDFPIFLVQHDHFSNTAEFACQRFYDVLA